MDGRLLLGCIADVRAAAETLIARAAAAKPRDGGWLSEARAALDNRPGRLGEHRRRRRRAACTRPKCSARCAPTSSAIPTRC